MGGGGCVCAKVRWRREKPEEHGSKGDSSGMPHGKYMGVPEQGCAQRCIHEVQVSVGMCPREGGTHTQWDCP